MKFILENEMWENLREYYVEVYGIKIVGFFYGLLSRDALQRLIFMISLS